MSLPKCRVPAKKAESVSKVNFLIYIYSSRPYFKFLSLRPNDQAAILSSIESVYAMVSIKALDCFLYSTVVLLSIPIGDYVLFGVCLEQFSQFMVPRCEQK